MKFKLFNKLVILRNPILIKKLPTLATLGLTNKTTDNYFLPFFDYDEVEYKVVLEDVDFLQKNFDIGSVIINVSSEEKELSGELVGNYHVIGFTKFTFPEIREIINLSRCHSYFKQGWKFQQRCWVLRILEKTDFKSNLDVKPKVRFKTLVKSKTNRVANLGMILFFEKLFGLKLKHLFDKVDDQEEVEIISYLT